MRSAYKYIAVVYPGLFVRVGRGDGISNFGPPSKQSYTTGWCEG